LSDVVRSELKTVRSVYRTV